MQNKNMKKQTQTQNIPQAQFEGQDIPNMTEKPNIELGKQCLKIVRAQLRNNQLMIFLNKDEFTDEQKRNRKYNDICFFLTIIGCSSKEKEINKSLGSPKNTRELIGKTVDVEVLENKNNEKYPRKVMFII